MIRKVLTAVAGAVLATSTFAEAQTASGAHGRYSSFAVKVPYAFDLPPSITSVYLTCQFADVDGRKLADGSVTIDLAKGTSGVAVMGYGDFEAAGADTTQVLSGQSQENLREVLASDRFALTVTCYIEQVSLADGQSAAVSGTDDGRYGIFPGWDVAAAPVAWLTEDYEQSVSRTFNEAENEALGAFDPGFVTGDPAEQARITLPNQSGGNGLSTLESILTRP